jgi:ankyrin repeat protein
MYRFRWAACQLDILRECLDLKRLEEMLSSLPKTLEETYARILGTISENYWHYTIRILQFLTYSERPLTVREAVDVIIVEPDRNPPFDTKLRIPVPRGILRTCSSLVSLITRSVSNESAEAISELRLAHFSVQQYLQSGRLDAAFPMAMAEAGRIFQKGLKETTAKKSITRICLAYLSQLDGQHQISEVRANFPLARYSAQYWMDHAGPVEADKDVQKCILRFFVQDTHAYTIWGKLFDPDSPSDEEPDQHRTVASPIYYASLAGLYYTVKMLLRKGADISAHGGYYSNPLQAASAGGHTKTVELLLQKGADIKAQDKQNNSALTIASENGHTRIVQLLLQKGADVNAQGGYYGNALQAASAGGYTETVQLLLKIGGKINAQNGWYGNALIAASAGGHSKTVQLLLEMGADINAQGEYYSNALQAASEEGHTGTVQVLLDMGADVNTQNWLYDNALQAASAGGYTNTVQLLLKKGANVNKQGGFYGNALQAASAGGYSESVRLLLEGGANVNAQGGEYGTALSAASKEGYTEIVQLLLEKGANHVDTLREPLPRRIHGDNNQSSHWPITSKVPAELRKASQASQTRRTSKRSAYVAHRGGRSRKRRRVGKLRF